MRKKEQLLWDAMKRNLPESLWMQRIENLVGDGMPDVYIGRTGKWVELKAPSRIPVRRQTPLLGKEGLRLSQVNWFLKHNTMPEAPNAYILIRTVERELLLIPGDAAEEVNQLSLSELRKINAADSWEKIKEALS